MRISNKDVEACRQGIEKLWELPAGAKELEFQIRARKTKNSVPVTIGKCCDQCGGTETHVRVNATKSEYTIIWQYKTPKLWSLLQRHLDSGKPIHVELLYEDQ